MNRYTEGNVTSPMHDIAHNLYVEKVATAAEFEE